MKPLPISAETAVKLAKRLHMPIEHLMHMPQHILMRKLAELAQEEQAVREQAKPELQSPDPEGKPES
ncbi:YycC family protein [Paenibacillus sp. HJGM_3]|uniref:YycC family protein n=1 Tax=Paenibacillus sp. HJGM_3 TaxID=3379816 RepID=UPI00385CA367